jgi:hypothetical protein
VELEGVEAAVRGHPHVRDVGVVARTDSDAARLIAFIEWRVEAEHQSLSELRRTLGQALPPHMLPWRFYAIPIVPRLPNSKLDVRALEALAAKQREEDVSRATALAPTAIETSPAALVAKTWRAVLEVSSLKMISSTWAAIPCAGFHSVDRWRSSWRVGCAMQEIELDFSGCWIRCPRGITS